ncbi:MATE family efflux transporter [Lentzea kentuckyensis]|uniref:MATE family efflux transporter n=1 Tax=Lentzea kentuckyensis TaxID=360086 RepID=UPI000A36BD60|nr:MATE family efflux transporter [Lentzea kentuckyensis]
MTSDAGAGRWPDVKEIVQVALPLYLSMIAVSLSALVNTAALGRFGTASLAGFAVTVAVYFPAMAAVSGAVRGVMPFVAAQKDNPSGLLRVVRDGTWLAVLVGVLGAAAVACVPLLANATGVPETTVAQLGPFPLLMAGCVLLNGFGSMATSSLVSLGRSEVVLHAGLLGAVCTAVLSPLLVTVAGMGLNGAGIALLTSNLVSSALTLYGLRRQLGVKIAEMIDTRVHFGQVMTLARVGIPMAGTVLVKFGVLGVLAFAAARVSTTAAAVHNIATALVSLTFTAAVAIGQAAVPIVSVRASRNDPRGVRRGVFAGLLTAMTTLSVICAVIVVLRTLVVPLFTSDQAVASAVTALLALVVLVILGDGLQAILGFGLTGLKRSTPSFVVFAVCYGTLALAAVPIAEHAGLTGLWVALAVANVLVATGQGLAFGRESARLLPVGV